MHFNTNKKLRSHNSIQIILFKQKQKVWSLIFRWARDCLSKLSDKIHIIWKSNRREISERKLFAQFFCVENMLIVFPLDEEKLMKENIISLSVLNAVYFYVLKFKQNYLLLFLCYIFN